MNVISDSATMLRRNLRHTMRNSLALFNGVVMPVFLMFLMGSASSASSC
ncbi:hypothetical protein AAH991_36980 [Microbispora sp. ZYX-F-249]|uniref:ABC transporter permease n=1 Tax=Microbispora maris TaxID=3144104 RepID=A0ABV0AZR3_9ACTN